MEKCLDFQIKESYNNYNENYYKETDVWWKEKISMLLCNTLIILEIDKKEFCRSIYSNEEMDLIPQVYRSNYNGNIINIKKILEDIRKLSKCDNNKTIEELKKFELNITIKNHNELSKLWWKYFIKPAIKKTLDCFNVKTSDLVEISSLNCEGMPSKFCNYEEKNFIDLINGRFAIDEEFIDCITTTFKNLNKVYKEIPNENKMLKVINSLRIYLIDFAEEHNDKAFKILNYQVEGCTNKVNNWKSPKFPPLDSSYFLEYIEKHNVSTYNDDEILFNEDQEEEIWYLKIKNGIFNSSISTARNLIKNLKIYTIICNNYKESDCGVVGKLGGFCYFFVFVYTYLLNTGKNKFCNIIKKYKIPINESKIIDLIELFKILELCQCAQKDSLLFTDEKIEISINELWEELKNNLSKKTSNEICNLSNQIAYVITLNETDWSIIASCFLILTSAESNQKFLQDIRKIINKKDIFNEEVYKRPYNPNEKSMLDWFINDLEEIEKFIIILNNEKIQEKLFV